MCAYRWLLHTRLLHEEENETEMEFFTLKKALSDSQKRDTGSDKTVTVYVIPANGKINKRRRFLMRNNRAETSQAKYRLVLLGLA